MFLGEDGVEVVREQFDVETIDGVWAAAVQVQALRLSDGVDSRYEVVKQNRMGEYHPRVYNSNCYPLPPSPNTRLFPG